MTVDRRLTRDQVVAMLSAQGEAERELRATADQLRRQVMGDAVHLRALVEFSNICRQDCHYCGIRRSNAAVRRYAMAPETIVAVAQQAHRLGYGTVVLQSGEGNALDPDQLAAVVRAIKQTTPLAVTLSVGERSPEEYALWRRAGADRYLLRHETADPELFSRTRPGRQLAQRLSCLETLRRLGYQVGGGFMVGLPDQTLESLAADILLLQELQVEMAGVGPFIPHPETPLAGSPGGSLGLTLKAVALTRLAIPDAHIPATTALGSIHPQGRQLALQCGANVVMPNVTPTRYRAQYQLYPGKVCIGDQAENCSTCVRAWLAAMGRPAGWGPGHSPRARFQGPGQDRRHDPEPRTAHTLPEREA